MELIVAGSEYSNLTSHILGMVVARACDTDLKSFAVEHLLGLLGIEPGFWKNYFGYQWWSIKAGNYHYHLAWGHGGQQIVIVDELDMVVVLLADALYAQHGDDPWKIEKGNLNLLADFVASLP